jgi:hypothetical protein
MEMPPMVVLFEAVVLQSETAIQLSVVFAWVLR